MCLGHFIMPCPCDTEISRFSQPIIVLILILLLSKLLWVPKRQHHCGCLANLCGCPGIIVGAHLSIVGARAPTKVYKLTPMTVTQQIRGRRRQWSLPAKEFRPTGVKLRGWDADRAHRLENNDPYWASSDHLPQLSGTACL